MPFEAENLDDMLGILKPFAPRAAIGYTDGLKKQYAQDPWSLISNS